MSERASGQVNLRADPVPCRRQAAGLVPVRSVVR